jgi:ribosomal protein L14
MFSEYMPTFRVEEPMKICQIMAVTGHKSASSVAVYQRVSSKEKQVMGDIITSSVRGEQPSQLVDIFFVHTTF